MQNQLKDMGDIQNMSQQQLSDLAAKAANDFKLSSGGVADLTPESQIYKEASELEANIQGASKIADPNALPEALDDLSYYRWYVMKCRKEVFDALADRATQLGDTNSAAQFKNLSEAIQRWSDGLDETARSGAWGNGFPVDYLNPENGARPIDIFKTFADGHPPSEPISGAPGWMQPTEAGGPKALPTTNPSAPPKPPDWTPGQRPNGPPQGPQIGRGEPGPEPAPAPKPGPPTAPTAGSSNPWGQELAQLRAILKPAPASNPATVASDLKGIVDELGTELKQLPADDPEVAELTTERNNLQKLLDGGGKGDAVAGDTRAADLAARARVHLNEIFDDSDSYVQQMQKMFADRTPLGRARVDGEWAQAAGELGLGRKSEADFVAAFAKADGNTRQLDKILDMLGEMHGNPGGGNPPSASLLDDLSFFRYYLRQYRRPALEQLYFEYAQRFGGPSQKVLLAQADAVDADIAMLDAYLGKYGPAPRYNYMELSDLRYVEDDLASIEDTSASHLQQDVQSIDADRSGFGRYNLMKERLDGLDLELTDIQNMSQQQVSDLAAKFANDVDVSSGYAQLTPESQIYKEADKLIGNIQNASKAADPNAIYEALDDLSYYRWYVVKCRQKILDVLMQRAYQLGDKNSAEEFKNLSDAIKRWSAEIDQTAHSGTWGNGFPVDYLNPANGARPIDIFKIFADGHPPDQPISGAPAWMQPGYKGPAPSPAALPASAPGAVVPKGGPRAPSFDDFPAEEMPSLSAMTAAVPVGEANGLIRAITLNNAALAPRRPQAGSGSTNTGGSTLQQASQLINSITKMTPAQLQQAASRASQLVANSNIAQSVRNLPPVTSDTLTSIVRVTTNNASASTTPAPSGPADVVTTVTAPKPTPLAPPSLSSMLPIKDVVNKITAAANNTSLSQDAKNMQIAMASLEGAAALDPTGIVGIISAYTKPLCSLVVQGTNSNGSESAASNLSGPPPPPPIPSAYTTFMNLSAAYLQVLRGVQGGPSLQASQASIQATMAQYTRALGQVQSVSLTSDQQAAVNEQEVQVNKEIQRVQSIPGGSQTFRKKLPGDN